jgi:hypothetical protein
MHQVASTPASIPQAIAKKLHRLRRSARMWLLVHGLGRFLLMVVAVSAVDALIDWWFRMDRAQRLLVLIGVGSALVYYLSRHVIAPLMSKITDDELCQRVERTNPQLAQRLISAVQFSRIGDLEALGVSPAMVDATIEEGTRMAADLDFGQSLRRSEFRRNSLWLALGAAGVIAIAAAVAIGAINASHDSALSGRDEQSHTLPGLADIWFNRNVLLGYKQWPQNTYLEVIGVDDERRLVFPRGDDKLLAVRVSEDSRVLPDMVRIDIQNDGVHKSLQMNVEGESGKEFSHLFKNVLEPFQFRVVGGDHKSDWYKVVLQPRPEVDSLDLVLTPPAYTGQDAVPLSREQSPYDVLPGSSLKISGTTNQPVQEAVLLGAKPLQADEKGQSGIAMTIEGGNRIAVAIDSARLQPGEYRIRLVNVDGLDSQLHPLFNIRNLNDENPSVAARLRGISSLITDRAVIPIEGKYTDDFAVDALRLVHSWRGSSEDSKSTDGFAIPPGIEEMTGAPTIEHTFRFDVSNLKLPVGAKLKLEMEAKDNDTVSGPKVKLSEPFFLSVVTPDELRADMLRREKDYRMEFERMLAEQESLSDTCRTVLAQAGGRGLMTDAERREFEQLLDKKADELNADSKKRLTQLQQLAKATEEIPVALARALKTQSRMPRQCMAVADRFEAVSLEAQNNRLEDKKKHFSEEMPNRIVAPLRTLGDAEIDQATKAIEAARRAMDEAATRDERLADAIEAQEKVVASMRQILKYMVKSEDYQDAVNFARKIVAEQERLAKEVEAARDAELEEIFGDDDDDAEAEPDLE